MRDLIKIKDPSAAAVFRSARQRLIVQSLIPEPLALAALARLTQMPLSLLHYHVSKCVELGLIEIVRTVPRAGRAVKHYRAAARTFFVPHALLAELPGAERAQALRRALERQQAQSVEGVSFTHDGLHPCVFLAKGRTPRAPAIELWLDVGLTSSDSAELIEDLKAVLQRYGPRDSRKAPRYIVHMAAVRA